MNPYPIRELVRVRYQLLWARTRMRNGKIALSIAGCLLFALGMVLVSAGGRGRGHRSGSRRQAQIVAQIVLTSLFVQAVLIAVIIGLGMNAMFSGF